MPRRSQQQTSRNPQSLTPPTPCAETGLTTEQVERWADMIADGRDEFPDRLPSPSRERLLAAVRERLRSRLVRHIARAIAAWLRRRAGSDTENTTHA
jgi:hypothetical protein